MLKRLRSLLGVLKSRDDFERGMAAEMQFHIEQYADDLVRAGVTRPEAMRRARIEFGGVNTAQEKCRGARGLNPFDELFRQLRHAARLLRKTPGFTATALLTLAICIGANLTIFAVVDAILLRPLPFPEAGRLVTIFNMYPKAGVDRDGSSIANYYERRGTIPAFAGIGLYSPGTAVLGEAGATERDAVMRVSPDFFSTLGADPLMGRGFTEQETSYQTDKVAILTDAYWRRQFQADPHVIGRQVRVDGVPCTVVGVLSPNYRFLSSEARVYLPFSSSPENRDSRQRHSGGNGRHMIARLAPGATVEQAQAQIDAQNAALETKDPEAAMIADAGFRSVVTSLHGDHVASVRPALLWMQAGAFALLLIGAVNLTNLLLIRASGRVKEIAVRQALGASRLHVASEVIVETTLLTVAGGALGLAAGAAGIRLLSAVGTDHLPLGSHVAFDTRVAFAAILGSIVMGFALAAPIAWFHLRGLLTSAIQSESRGGTSGRAAQRLRHAFIVTQVALALVLLSGAGMLGRSLQRTMAVSPGFRADHILTGQLSVPMSTYPNATARLALNRRLLEELSRQPGVSAAGIVSNVPFSGNEGKSAATVKGRPMLPGERVRAHYSYGVDGDYFAAMGFALRAGRFLNADDSRRTSPGTPAASPVAAAAAAASTGAPTAPARVCVVDADFAAYYWPQGSALGQRIFEGSEQLADDQAFTVVGVVGAVKQAGLTDQAAQGAVYYPYAFRTDNSVFMVVRTSLPPESLGASLQSVVRRVDPELPVNDLRAMDTRIADSLVAQRTPALLAGIFSAIAVLLTAIGTYGVLSYAVTQRRREIGVRMALGARPGQIRGHFLALAFRLLLAGAALGIAGAWLMGRAMRTMLFQASPLDSATFAAAGIIGVVSLAACLLPSYRAARISPMEALADQ